MLDTLCVETLVPSERVKTPWGGHNDVGALSRLEEFLILLDGSSTVKDGSADIGHVFSESEVFISDLEGEFARVAEYDDRDTVFRWVELLESCEDEDSSLSMTRLRLAKHVHAEDRLRDAFLLHWKHDVRMAH